jgi:hypothetical protein
MKMISAEWNQRVMDLVSSISVKAPTDKLERSKGPLDIGENLEDNW